MCVRVKRFPEFGVTLNVYSGALTPDVMLRFIDTLEPVRWARWINYLDATLDMSGLDVAHIPVLKHALAARLSELHGDKALRSALVTASPVNQLFLQFWPSYVGLDVSYPASPAAFPTLEAACEWLGLPRRAQQPLAEAVAAR